MGGISIKTPSGTILSPRSSLLNLFESSALPQPSITDADIDDRSKADWFAKSVALVQVTWFVAQLLGRAIQKLPITTLELFTLGTVVCAMLTYAFWWEKPFDIERPIVVDEPERPVGTEGDSVVPDELYMDGLLVDMDYEIASNALIFGILGALFGALHIVAWNFAFPTEVERMMWRVGSVLCAVAPLVFSAASFWIERH